MTAILISCNNATCAVPEAYREIFRGAEDEVTSTAGWEPGSLNLAQALAMRFRTQLVHGDVTRLLIDLDRDGDDRWSRFAMKLPETTRHKIVERHELPYRSQLGQRIAEDLRRHAVVLHVMVHTEAATDGRVTMATPPGAALAASIATAWHELVRADGLDVRQVRDAASGAVGAALCRDFPLDKYAPIQLAVSQTFFLEGRPWRWETLKKRLMEALAQALAAAPPVSVPESPLTGPG